MNSCKHSDLCMWLWSVWVKTPKLNNNDILIVSACLPYVNREIYENLSNRKQTLFACPEREPASYYGKIASIIKSSKPRTITVATIDGSPHCFQLHAAVNEAVYITGEEVDRKHYVIVDGEKIVEISPDSVRVARYLHLVEKLINAHPEILEELKKHSLEYIESLKNRRELKEL
ncbi:MAG: 4Fe-4S ferredoxin [Ignisphaera sp.]|nr:4Fe-4S ferredoxin [Ignisphaera sp.]MCX8168213.1 4Fe-4S ferredoxin [Ignisphaera sp.]MDW8084917.1 4Fe-4S ferredoxin [Ignisphaera sp.]